MTQTPFDILKQTCHDACHERHACTDGYKQMLASENVSQMMACWRDNINDITTEKFADIANRVLPSLYAENKEEMNKAGIYVNECPVMAKAYTIVLITDCSLSVHIFEDATGYVIGNAEVYAHDHSRVYNRKSKDAVVTAFDFSMVTATHGTVHARQRSSVLIAGNAVCHCYNQSKVNAKSGLIVDHGHFHINAEGDAIIETSTVINISTQENAKINII